MKQGMALEVIRPIGSSLPAVEPFLWRLFEGRENVLLDLPVPGQDILRGTTAPTEIYHAVDFVRGQAALIVRSALFPDGADHIGLAVRHVNERILDGPWVPGLGPGEPPVPFLVREF